MYNSVLFVPARIYYSVLFVPARYCVTVTWSDTVPPGVPGGGQYGKPAEGETD